LFIQISHARRNLLLILVIISSVGYYGCLPVPSATNLVVDGHLVASDQVRMMVARGETIENVKVRLGMPNLNLGPGRIFVYLWAEKEGTVIFLLPGLAPLASEAATSSHLFFVAFDSSGVVLETGTSEFGVFSTVTEEVRQWRSTSNLVAEVTGPRPVENGNQAMLFVYRKQRSQCPFPTFDSNIFKPSIAVNGQVVGDLSKGEYLGINVDPGAQLVTIDPVPAYRIVGREEGSFTSSVSQNRIVATAPVNTRIGEKLYVEIYLCTGLGAVQANVEVRDAASGFLAIEPLAPAW